MDLRSKDWLFVHIWAYHDLDFLKFDPHIFRNAEHFPHEYFYQKKLIPGTSKWSYGSKDVFFTIFGNVVTLTLETQISEMFNTLQSLLVWHISYLAAAYI